MRVCTSRRKQITIPLAGSGWRRSAAAFGRPKRRGRERIKKKLRKAKKEEKERNENKWVASRPVQRPGLAVRRRPPTRQQRRSLQTCKAIRPTCPFFQQQKKDPHSISIYSLKLTGVIGIGRRFFLSFRMACFLALN